MDIILSTKEFIAGLTDEEFNGLFFDKYLNNKFKIKSGDSIFYT